VAAIKLYQTNLQNNIEKKFEQPKMLKKRITREKVVQIEK
jgi:hypothetical protein